MRLQGDAPLGARWRIVALAEVRSAQPVVRVAELYYIPPLTAPNDSLSGVPLYPAYLYAPEGSARGNATAWLDVGTRLRINGPWRMRTELGFAVTNLVYGPVAPLEPVSPAAAALALRSSPGGLRGVPYQRRFSLPPVPSVTVRVAF